MRSINKIIIHCSDSDVRSHDNIATIREWHINERGWSDVGYHYFIRSDGSIEIGRPITKAGAHVKGHNKDSIGICLHGKEHFSKMQMDSAVTLICNIKSLYPNPLTVHGHCEFSQKTCPNFDYTKWIINRL